MRISLPALAGLATTASLIASAAHASTFQTLYEFAGGADGATPYGKLVMDKAGTLYGVTVNGGTASRGTVFSLDPVSLTLTSLYSFSGADGSNPQSGLVLDGKGNLYGVTPSGGSTPHCSSGCGTVFKLNIASGKLKTLYRFTGLADGAQPIGPVLLDAGQLYGTTTYGGTGAGCPTQGCGTVFRLAPTTKTLTTLRELVPNDGIAPVATLVRAPSGLLYGTASEAGPHGSGTVFRLDLSSETFAVVHGFDYHVDGSGSDADLLIKKGFTYGTMRAGGPTAAGDGTIYKLDPGTGTVTTLYSFPGQGGGIFPDFGVVAGAKGLLYGATVQGGGSGAGTLFQFNPKTLAFAMSHDFDISDGVAPSGPLLADKSGALYGVTSGGGHGSGTVFKLVP